MVPRANASVDRRADCIEYLDRRSLLLYLVVRSCLAEFEHHFSAPTSNGGERGHQTWQKDTVVETNVGAAGSHRRTARRTKPEHHGIGGSSLTIAQNLQQCILSGCDSQIRNPNGDAVTGLIIPNCDDRHMGEHLCRARGRHTCGGMRPGVLALPHVAKVGDRSCGVGPNNAIAGKSCVALKLTNGSLRVGPEDAVGLPTRKTQHVERLLQDADIASVEMGQAQIQRSITECEARIDERGPSLASDDSILRETVFALKLANGLGGQPQEDAINPRRPKIVAERKEATLYVLNGGATGARPHVSHSWRFLRTSCAYQLNRKTAVAV